MRIRYCNKCDLKIDSGEPDPCIGKYIEGIAHACCGHGDLSKAYCCGWPNCHPDEMPGIYGSVLNIPGFWRLTKNEALEYMEIK